MTASFHVERPAPAYWHFNNSLLEDVGFVASFWEFWLAWRGQQRAFPSARRWWDLGKVHARLFYRNCTWGASRWRDDAIEQLEQELWDRLPMVSMGDRDWLELPLSLAEFSEALCRMPTNKSLG
ncbi:unnamed protein product [Caretta caretta]